MNIVVYCSSITGNTRKLACHIVNVLKDTGHTVELKDSSKVGIREQPEGVLPDIFILAFWCRKSGLDDISAGLLRSWQGRRIIGIGTIGGDAKGDYGKRVRTNVREAISKENICLGVEICQGAVNLKRVEKRRYLSEKNKHYVSPEKYQRYLKTQGHPDQEELEMVAAYVRDVLS